MKKILSFGSKQFATGLAPSAHSESSGLFFKADGVTPIYEPGTDQSVNNGFLMPGQSGTVVSGTPAGSFLGATKEYAAASKAYFTTSTGRLFSWTLDNTFSAALANLRTVTGLTYGLEIFRAAGGAAYLYYWNADQIGRFDLAATYVDNYYAAAGTVVVSGIQTEYIHATHRYFNKIIWGNGRGKIGTMTDVSGTVTVTSGALNIPSDMTCTDISDDGTYVVLAVTNNIGCDTTVLADTRIIFWDSADTLWTREFQINDPFIYSLEKTPFGLFAFGATGIWQVSFGGIKKVYSRSPGIYSTNAYSQITYGKACATYFTNALVWGGASGSNKVIKSFGQLDIALPAATVYPFLSTASKNITYVDGQMLKGYVLVGDDTPQLKAYPFSTANIPQTGLLAQTVYIPLGSKYQIERIDVIFGEPLVSGDAMSIQLKTDEDTAASTAMVGSFAQDGAIRRKKMYPDGFVADEQLSIVVNFTTGIPKIKRIDVWGTPMSS